MRDVPANLPTLRMNQQDEQDENLTTPETPTPGLRSRLTERPVIGFAVLGVASLIALALLLVVHVDHNSDVRLKARNEGQVRLASARDLVDEQLAALQANVQAVADELNAGVLDQSALNEALQQRLTENSQFWSIGVAYDFEGTGIDYDFSTAVPASTNSTPYFNTPGGEVTFSPFPYDYFVRDESHPDYPRGWWFRDGLVKGSHWTGAYFGNTSRRMIAEFVAPFAHPDSNTDTLPAASGVALGTYTLESLNSNVSWLDLGASGYGLMLAGGQYVIHPIPEYWLQGRTVEEVVGAGGNQSEEDKIREAALNTVVANSAARTNGFVDYVDEITGREAWLFYETVPSTGWTLGYVLIKSEALGSDPVGRRQMMGIGTAGLLAIFAATAIFIMVFGHGAWRVWGPSMSFATMSALGIALIWTVTTSYGGESATLTDGSSLRSIVDEFEANVLATNPDLSSNEIFAGVFVNTVEFRDDNVVVSGIVWQRYLNRLDKLIEPGFTFPDDVGPTTFSVAYDRINGLERTVGWRFRATLQTSMDFSKFPFDAEDVSIRLRHREFDKPIVLIPDIPQYDLIVPVARPGLEDSFEVNGWTVDRSFFNYTTTSINSRFGIPDFSRVGVAPELRFNVRLKRDFLNVFISRMLPLIVVSFLVFAVLLTVSSHPDRRRQFGTTTANVLAFSGSLMFVTILGHNALRSALNSSEIIYLEYFYFVAYFAILAVAVNSILINSGRGGRLLFHGDNIVARLGFWPMVTGAGFLITWAQFY